MTSSWAGAFGQTQFIPSAFLRYAVDGDGDGKRDLWRSPADALASAANLLPQSGWERESPWGYAVVLPPQFSLRACRLLDKPPLLPVWRNLGVRAAGGWDLPVSEARAAIYLPAGAHGPAFIVFDNFRTVLKYNNAASYALAVCSSPIGVKGYVTPLAAWPRDEVPLSRAGQLAIADETCDGWDFCPGRARRRIGPTGAGGLRAWQKSRGLIHRRLSDRTRA